MRPKKHQKVSSQEFSAKTLLSYLQKHRESLQPSPTIKQPTSPNNFQSLQQSSTDKRKIQFSMSKMIQNLISPTHVKTQPHSHQNSTNKFKTQSQQLQTAMITNKSDITDYSNKKLTIVFSYKNFKQKYLIDTSVNKIRWLLNFIKQELHYLDNSDLKLIGLKTQNISVPLDYILSNLELPLSILQDFPLQPIIISPILEVKQQKMGSRLGLKDFEFIRCIGMGGFSQVYLVREKSTGSYFAMKLIEKNSIIEQTKQSIIQNERDIMISLNHSFIVKLYASFESQTYLVFVLEYCSGGELFYLLRKIKRMTEEEAFFYFSEICLAMKHLHDNNIVYRDIKPENILIDFDGHLRIADFGLSKPNMHPDDVAYSFCGSPEYMAPEMLLKSGHSFSLDLYCLGALLYEMVTGLPPFYSRNIDEIYQKILNQKLTFPLPLSNQIKDLMTLLLHKNPKKRISTVESILEHQWMKQWGDLREFIESKQMKPPYIPNKFKFNFDEEEFGRGENEFLAQMCQLQQNVMENYPRNILLKDFYYNYRDQQDHMLNSQQLKMSINISKMEKENPEYFGQLSQRSSGVGVSCKKPFKQTHNRMNTLDDQIENSMTGNLKLNKEPVKKVQRLLTDSGKVRSNIIKKGFQANCQY